MYRIFWSSLIFGLFLVGCVPNKNYVYLQENDVNKKNLPTDTIVRTYDLAIRDYKIQPLDILSVRVESLTEDQFDFMAKLDPNQQMNGMMGGGGAMMGLMGFLVDNEGQIEFPVVGKVKVSGLSVFETQSMLQKKFEPLLQSPVVRVRLLNFRFTVLGEVRAEQQVTSTNTRVTMMEAIGLAGGLTDMADRKNVKVIRQIGDRSEVFYLNLLQEDLLSADHYYVQQNDIVVVPALRQRPFRTYWSQNLGLFVSTVSVVLLAANLFK